MLSTEAFKEIFFRYRYFLLIIFGGLIILGLGIIVSRVNVSSTRVEVLEATTEGVGGQLELVVEIAGEVESPGVYKMPAGVRVEDLLVAAGGLTGNADRDWLAKSLNRAAKLTDGQKIYIKDKQSQGESAKNTSGYQNISSNFSAQGSGLVNINTASLKELIELPEIGQSYATNIIEHRPYSNIEELVSKGALKQGVYEKIKAHLTAY